MSRRSNSAVRRQVGSLLLFSGRYACSILPSETPFSSITSDSIGDMAISACARNTALA